ncbi:hypothetical protein Acr_05g0009620 [Actinidia rufa]|uniref:Uncharacterized protein n=1 Tax=Actinidia rufa TaxID=165716 RepID=A0A7J0ELI2_9ERIC|nr:hypothetical protein Acr_05g0009620 [Actinidia rufa]
MVDEASSKSVRIDEAQIKVRQSQARVGEGRCSFVGVGRGPMSLVGGQRMCDGGGSAG